MQKEKKRVLARMHGLWAADHRASPTLTPLEWHLKYKPIGLHRTNDLMMGETFVYSLWLQRSCFPHVH